MAEVDWDRRYREGFYDSSKEPHELLVRFCKTIPAGTIIDIAMGNGRDLAFIAGAGYRAIGLERSREALKGFKKTYLPVPEEAICLLGDAHYLPFKDNVADGIIVFYFLLRDIMEDIRRILKRGGVIIYETFLKRQNAIERWRNPEYLLEDGELISYFKGFDLLFYEETITAKDKKSRAIARYVGRKR